MDSVAIITEAYGFLDMLEIMGLMAIHLFSSLFIVWIWVMWRIADEMDKR